MSDPQTLAGEDLACPVCSYSLRGLPEPRCPECGYTFEWDALRLAKKHRHPYLFEHGTGLAIMRLLKTFFHGLRPRKFWTTLSAAHKIHPRRLTAYWVVSVVALVLATTTLPYGSMLAGRIERNHRIRATFAGWATNPQLATNPQYALQTKQIIRQFGSMQAFLDQFAPSVWSWRFWQPLPGAIRWSGVGRGYGESLESLAYALAFVALWPWITLALLAIFVKSLSRAKIRRAQLVRCVIYCGDAAVFSAVLIFIVNQMQFSLGRRFQGVLPMALMLVLFVALAAGGKLSVALSRYLRMPHAAGVVAATQIIAILLLLIVMPQEAGDWVLRLLYLHR